MSSKESFLIFTDEQCLIHDVVQPEIPLLLSSDNLIVEAPSDWLRYLIVVRKKSLTSVRQFAYHLKSWWSYLSYKNINWDEADDFDLMSWRNLLIEKQLQNATINNYISTVFRMYLWAERKGYTLGVIGEADSAKNIRPQITVDVSMDQRGRKQYTSPLLIKTTTKPILPTPTNEEISRIHQALLKLYKNNIELIIRDSLILMLMEQTGTRRAEALSIKTNQIPEWDELIELSEKDEKKQLTIKGKGNKIRSIFVGVNLLIQLREYIEIQRYNLVKRFRSKLGSTYTEPQEIFLSSKTGLVLNPDSVSQSLAKSFRIAGVKGSGHRIRARFLTNLVTYQFESEFERLGSIPDATSTLLPVAEIAGHQNVETLKPYLAVPRKRLLQQTSSERVFLINEKLIETERRTMLASVKLNSIEEVHDLVEAIHNNDKDSILEQLKRLSQIYTD